MTRRATALALALLTLAWSGAAVRAENIDPNDEGLHYAYGENVGWINFKPDQDPGVTVTATAVTGFAWAENIGWINLSPMGGGVVNDGQGNLSGFAWGENVGWINFAPTGGGVVINLGGFFIGHAWGENIGWITFNSSGEVPFGVRTGWRVAVSAVPALNDAGVLGAILVLLGVGAYAWRRQRPLPARVNDRTWRRLRA